MKRAGNLFPKIISDENLKKAIKTVCNSHRWIHYPDRPNPKVLEMECNIDSYADKLKEIIENGFTPSPVKKKRRYDANAEKWREISEPRIFPDQCVHHALIQVLEPVMMRGMDKWCCGSIKKRGAHYGIRAIKKWMKAGKGVKWCIEMDIRHFYDSLKPDVIMKRMKRLIKDFRTLDLICRIIKGGILIGAYYSQWLANTFLQPLDVLIRKSGATHYIRYMDNFTVFTNKKRTADKIMKAVAKWLEENGLELKGNWQKFKTSKRLPNAMGYRFGKRYTLIRKKNLIRLIHQLKKFYRMRERRKSIRLKFAQGLLSRLGMLRHCNSVMIYKRFVRKRTQRHLKDIVREYYGREREKWNIYLARPSAAA